MRNLFCPTELDGLFKNLGFHRLLAKRALELTDLLIGGSELGDLRHILA